MPKGFTHLHKITFCNKKHFNTEMNRMHIKIDNANEKDKMGLYRGLKNNREERGC